MDGLESRRPAAENGDLDEHIADPNYTTGSLCSLINKDIKRSIRFVEYLAKKHTSPEDILINHRAEISEAAASVGVILPEILILDSAWHYVPNSGGKNDKKQSYKGEYRTDTEGATTPSMTVHNFKETSLPINIRNMAFQEYEAYKFGNSIAPLNGNIEAYKASSKILTAKAAAQKAIQEKQKIEGHEAAAKAAVNVWAKAQDNPEHPYLERKKIGAHGTKIAKESIKARLWSRYEDSFQEVVVCEAGELIIPVRDSTTHELINIQRISQDKDKPKRFLHGGQTTGGYYGLPGRGMEIVCEGFATAATVAEAGGYSVLVAFSAGNMPNVTKAIPSIKAVAADNDKSGAGKKAAESTGLKYVMPDNSYIKPSHKGVDWNDVAVRYGMEAVTHKLKAFENSLIGDAEVEASKPTLLMSPDEFMATPQPLVWTIKGIIEDQTTGMLFGPSGGGKSFLAISMAASIGSGINWYGHKVRQGAVVYSNGEGFNGLRRRFKAWEINTETKISNIYPTRVPVIFGDAKSVQRLSDEIKLLPVKPSLIVIDTLARATTGMEENSSKEMGVFIESVDKLRREHECSVLIVHHSGKNADGGARGSSAIKAAMDFEICLTLKNNGSRLQIDCSKMKEAERFKPMAFEFHSIELPIDWVDDDGERLRSAVLCSAPVEEDEIEAVPARGVSPSEATILKCLIECQEKQMHVQLDKNTYDPSNPPSVENSHWHDAVKAKGLNNFSSYVPRLIKKHKVEQFGEGPKRRYRPI